MTETRKDRPDLALILVPLLLVVGMCLYFFLRPEAATNTISLVRQVLDGWFSSWYCLVGVGFFLCSLALAFSPIGKIQLGEKRADSPSSFRWGCMVFTSTMAADIVFYSLCEWALYIDDPFIAAHGSVQDWAATFPLFHWGPIAWSFYLVLAAAFGFMLYVRGRSTRRMSEACRPILGCRVDGGWGRVIDLLSIFALLAGTATTFSLSVPLLSSAIGEIFGIPGSMALSILILVCICAVYSLTVWLGMDAISRLSSLCVWLFFALLAYVGLGGGRFVYILETGITAIGSLAQNFIGMSTQLDPLRQTAFPQNWTMFYWAYWMVWCVATPFFIGQISAGRTVRQVILGGYAWGLAGTWLSFIVLGNYGLSLQMMDGLDISGAIVSGASYSQAILAILSTLPQPKIALILVVLSMVAFYCTTFDALTLIAASYCCKTLRPDQLPGRGLRMFWAVMLILLPIALLFSEETMNNLQSVSLIAALPISLVLILIAASFIKDSRQYLQEP
jgi:BCCT family betaine/carnitine transporter